MPRILSTSFVLFLLACHLQAADPITELLKAGGRTVLRKGASTAVRHGAKHAAKQVTRHTAKQAAQAAARAQASQLVRHFGDDAIRAGGKLAGKAPAYADDLAKISKSLTPRNQRRLMMLAPEIKKSGRAAKIIKDLAKNSKTDDALEALWRHRGKIAAATAVAAVAVHADDLAKAGGEFVAKPLIEQTIEHVAKPMVPKLTNMFACGLLALGVMLAIRFTQAWGYVTLAIQFGRNLLDRFSRRRITPTDGELNHV